MVSCYRYDIISSRWSSQFWVKIHVWFLILGGKIQVEAQYGDHCWWRHRSTAAPPPLKYTSSCQDDKRLSSKGKIVSKYCHNQKLWGGVPSNQLFFSLFFFCSFFFLDLNALDLAPIGNVALYLAITLSRSSTRCRTFKPTWDFIPDDAVECVVVWWIKIRVRVGGHIIILTEREGGQG